MKPTTLEEALSMVPTHWPLSSRRDKWQKGDQYFAHNLPFDDSDDNWVDVGPYHIESIEVVMPDELGRRPIPQDTRRRTAEIVLAGAKIKAAGVDAAWQHFTHNFPLESWILAGKP